MPDFWFFLTSTALFDSLSTAVQIVIFIFLFSTKKPVATSVAFLVGLSLTYLVCGVLFLGQMDAINAFFAQFFPKANSVSDPQYYLLQLGFGVLCVAGSLFFAFRKKKNRGPSMEERLSIFLQVLNPVTAAILGVVFSVTGFPASLPYLGALEKLAKAFGPNGALPGVLYYNFIYVVPLLIPLGIYLAFRNHVEGIEAKLHLHSRKWASLINYGLTIFLGILFVADSAVFFATGHPLLASKFF